MDDEPSKPIDPETDDLPMTLPPLKSCSSYTTDPTDQESMDTHLTQSNPSTLKSLLSPNQQQELTPDFLINNDSSLTDTSEDEDHKSSGGYSPFMDTGSTPRAPQPHHVTSYREYPLPPDKEYHVFITHSTGDLDMVYHKLKKPLVNCYHQKIQVTNSSEFKEGDDYNNDAIKKAMRRSCAILIGISDKYLRSERCDREWKKAIECCENIIVVALGLCPRPPPIKQYLYLDFVDSSKRETVWKVLQDTINKYIAKDPHHHTQSQGHHHSSNSSIDHNLSMTQFFNEQSQLLSGSEMEQDGVDDGGGDTVDTDNMGSSEEQEDMVMMMMTQHQREEGELSDDTGGSLKGDKGEESDRNSPDQLSPSGHEVAGFYDSLAKPGADNRDESPIFYMRNFNNWVKSVLIRKYLRRPGAYVLDLCCGKGGDLNKWKEGGIDHLVCADISEVSIERCRERYDSRRMLYKGNHVFSAEFIVADCCKTRLLDLYKSATRFNIASCQFSLHYAFESYEKAMVMLRNACENLLPNGYFIGTTVDANELVRRLRKDGYQDDNGAWAVGNEVYSVTLDGGLDPNHDMLPLFNCKYHFKLEGVVNVPEYLVYYPLLVKMLEEFGMKEVLHQNFYAFFEEHRHVPRDVKLMFNMKAFDRESGTMSQAEWEVIGLYLVFVFEKIS